MLVSKSLCLVSVMLQRLPAVLSRIGIILASPLVRPPIALGRGHDFARYRVSPLRITFLAVDSTRFDTCPRLGVRRNRRLSNSYCLEIRAKPCHAGVTFLFLHIFSFSLFLVLSLVISPSAKEKVVCTCKVLTAS